MTGRRSNLEWVYGFENVTFRQYITARRLSPTDSWSLGDAMSEDAHPLVRYAAGWAAVELALYRPRLHALAHKVPFEDRQESLRIAENRWSGLLPEFEAWRKTQPTDKRRGSVMTLENRLREAVAYLPLMEVGASMLADEPLSPEAQQARFVRTRRQTAQVGRMLLAFRPRNEQEAAVKQGAVREMACGSVGQVVLPGDYLILPSSVRQDHNAIRALRADYLALSTHDTHRKTLLQVTWPAEEYPSGKYCRINADNDLALSRTASVSDTVTGFADWVEGVASPTTELQLQSASQRLRRIISEYTATAFLA